MLNPTSLMSKRVLSKTGVELPILGFGTAASGQRLNLKQAVQLYEAAYLEGITYFDTAPEFAGYGKAQSQLSHLLKQVRPRIFLVTKCYEPDGERALRLLESNLRELGTTYAALMKAKLLGLTRFVGLSGHSRPSRFVYALRQFEIDVLLNAVNFVDRHTYNFEEHLWPAAAQANIGLIAMKVFGGAQDPPPNTLSHSQLPVEYYDMAFRYALSQPHVCCASIGMATRRELEENLARARTVKPLSIGEARRLHDVGALLARQWTNHFGPVT